MSVPAGILRPYLKPGEQVLWSGRPAAAPLAHSYRRYGWVGLHIFMIPVFIFLMLHDIDDGLAAVLSMPPQYLVISALGALLMLWPRWKGLRASRIAYAVTDRRILIAEGGRTRSFGPEALSVILRRERGDRLADLTFGEDAGQAEAHPRSWHTSEYDHNLSHRPGFFGIADSRPAEAAAFTLSNGRP